MNGHSEAIPRWKVIAREHRKKQLSLIPSEWHLKEIPRPEDCKNAIPVVEADLSPEELAITSLSQSLPALQTAVASKQYTAVQITRAFCHRAALLQQLTNCLTEILFTSALEQAAQQDAHYNTTGKLLGPLHGIPISIKDNQDIKDVDSTLGWTGLINRPAPSDSPGVATIRQAAGILYCKTNLPQSMMMSDSYNHLYGQSVNSLNRLLISGGSSGGEAALIAGGGSLVGIGTDIGGSIRIPATLHNLYGLSPSVGRIGNRESTRHPKYLVPPVAGPLARDLDTLHSFMAAYSSTLPWQSDPAIIPMPWNQDIIDSYRNTSGNARPLRIGYITDDTVIRPHPPCLRAVTSTMSLLKRHGHTTIDCTSALAKPFHERAYTLWRTAILADGGFHIRKLMESTSSSSSEAGNSEPLIPGMLVGQPSDHLTPEQRLTLSDDITAFQKEYLATWHALNLDCLVMPVTQWAGLRPREWVEREMYVGYTSIWNLMDWTSLCIPSGVVVDKTLDNAGYGGEEGEQYTQRSRSDQLNRDGWDVEFFEGMPVGVQVVTGRLQEEKAVGVAWMLQDLRRREGVDGTT